MPIEGTTNYSWSESLEQWVEAEYGLRMLRSRSTFPFAPRYAPKPHLYYKLPILAIVVTRTDPHRGRALVEALRLFQESTYAFRLLLVTDDVSSPTWTDFEWPLEQIPIESEWQSISRLNWLEACANEIRWIQKNYGVSMVVSASTTEHALSLLEHIASHYDVSHRVTTQGIEAILSTEDSRPRLRPGFRGWLETVSKGLSSSTVLIDRQNIEIEFWRGKSNGLLIDPLGTQPLLNTGAVVRGAGWSTASFDGRKISDWSRARAILSLRDGLGGPGPTILLTSPETEARPVLWSDSLDGILTQSMTARGYTLKMGYGPPLTFPYHDLHRYMTGIQEIHYRTQYDR